MLAQSVSKDLWLTRMRAQICCCRLIGVKIAYKRGGLDSLEVLFHVNSIFLSKRASGTWFEFSQVPKGFAFLTQGQLYFPFVIFCIHLVYYHRGYLKPTQSIF